MTTYGSVCSGIEAASVAWHPLGWRAAWLSEIEPFPSAVLAHHYPDVPNLGDLTKIARRILTGEVAAPDVLVGGTPCQAFSVAGLRQSLSDERGNLSLKFCELADAIDHVRVARGDAPAIIVWENVPGVLSTSDNAFGCFLGALAGEDCELQPAGKRWADAGCVYGPTRAVAWRILDAQYFGLAQRRRRVFVVASARPGFDPASVLFERDGVRRDHPPRREAREVAPTIPARSSGGVGLGTDFDCDGGLIPQGCGGEVAPTLNAAFGSKLGLENQHIDSGAGLFVAVGPLTAGMSKGPRGTEAVDSHHLVAHTLRGSGFDASAGCAGRGTPLVPVAFSIMPMNSGKDYKARAVEVAQPLMAGGPVGGNQGGDFIVQPLAFDTTQITSAANYSNPQPGDACHPLAAGAHPPAIAYAIQAGALRENPASGPDGVGVQADVSYTLEARSEVQCVAFPANLSGTQCAATADLAPAMGAKNPTAVAFQQTADCLTAAYGTKWNGNASATNGSLFAATASAVRRLTPRECERLQGFPDDWTLIPVRGKTAADGPRYKALGNSMAVPVMRWIGRRIDAAINALEVAA